MKNATKNIFFLLLQMPYIKKERMCMLRILIMDKDLDDEKVNKLISIITAVANSDDLEVVILEE